MSPDKLKAFPDSTICHSAYSADVSVSLFSYTFIGLHILQVRTKRLYFHFITRLTHTLLGWLIWLGPIKRG